LRTHIAHLRCRYLRASRARLLLLALTAAASLRAHARQPRRASPPLRRRQNLCGIAAWRAHIWRLRASIIVLTARRIAHQRMRL
jgi:hypothetical protein